MNIWYKCTKKKKNGKFYGCEKLYFTKLLYQRKRKARDRKENLTTAPSQSCFVTVSVFVGISVDVLHVEGYRNGSEYVQRPLTPSSDWRFTQLFSFWTARRAVNTGADDTLRNLDQSCSSQLQASILPDGHKAGVSRLKLCFCLSSLPRGLSLFPLSTFRHPTGLHHWFYWTASLGMHYWLVNEDYE